MESPLVPLFGFFVVIYLMYPMYQKQPSASREEKELSALPAEEE